MSLLTDLTREPFPPVTKIVDRSFTRRFLKDCYRGRTPFVMESAADDWPAVRSWTPDFFARAHGQLEVEVAMTPEHNLLTPDGRRSERTKMTLGQYIRECLADRQADEQYYYLSKSNFIDLVPDLRQCLQFPEINGIYSRQNTFAWISPKGSITPLHYDLPDNFFVQLYGNKRFILAPPLSRHLMRAHPLHTEISHVSKVNPLASDRSCLEFPWHRLTETTLRPGDVLYIPSGWWHFVETLSTSISANRWVLRLTHQFKFDRVVHEAFRFSFQFWKKLRDRNQGHQ